eukprot:2215702-Amphidinium_carterae.3
MILAKERNVLQLEPTEWGFRQWLLTRQRRLLGFDPQRWLEVGYVVTCQLGKLKQPIWRCVMRLFRMIFRGSSCPFSLGEGTIRPGPQVVGDTDGNGSFQRGSH